MPGPDRNLWLAAVERDPHHARAYAERWRRFAAEGRDLDGEARLINAMAPRGARILDAGCGTGRVGGRLLGAGHAVTGVDLDPDLIAVARADHPAGRWLVQNLALLDVRAQDGTRESMDLVVAAGNVLTFLAEQERVPALAGIAAHLAADGRLVCGFATGRGYPLAELTADAERAGLLLVQAFGTWDLRPFTGDFLVAVLERADAAPVGV